MQVYALGYAGICVGLRKYMRWAMQVYALGFADACEGHRRYERVTLIYI